MQELILVIQLIITALGLAPNIYSLVEGLITVYVQFHRTADIISILLM